MFFSYAIFEISQLICVARIPELIFQPSMIGIEQAGIAEVIDFVLKKYSREEQARLSQVRP